MNFFSLAANCSINSSSLLKTLKAFASFRSTNKFLKSFQNCDGRRCQCSPITLFVLKFFSQKPSNFQNLRVRMTETYILLSLFTICLLESALCNYSSRCHSCFSHCKTLPDGNIDSENCDCTGQLCASNNCFVKIEIFPDKQTAIIQVCREKDYITA